MATDPTPETWNEGTMPQPSGSDIRRPSSSHVLLPHLIDLPKITDPRGNLTFIEENHHIPFPIKRVFFLYDIPTGADRGAHAHHKLHQFIVCLAGSFDVALDNGYESTEVHLNRPWRGLHIPPMIWASEINFDPGSVCLVMASEYYAESDYIRDYDEYCSEIGVAKAGHS